MASSLERLASCYVRRKRERAERSGARASAKRRSTTELVSLLATNAKKALFSPLTSSLLVKLLSYHLPPQRSATRLKTISMNVFSPKGCYLLWWEGKPPHKISIVAFRYTAGFSFAEDEGTSSQNFDYGLTTTRRPCNLEQLRSPRLANCQLTIPMHGHG